MRSIIIVASTLLALLFVLACDSSSGADGEACANVAEYSCFDNIVHRCDLDNGTKQWRAEEDCAQSSTSNCHCTTSAGNNFGFCSTDGETSGACQGRDL